MPLSAERLVAAAGGAEEVAVDPLLQDFRAFAALPDVRGRTGNPSPGLSPVRHRRLHRAEAGRQSRHRGLGHAR
jgi:hypothetical protein